MTAALKCERLGCLTVATHAVPLADLNEIQIEFWCGDHVETIVYGLDDTATAARVAGPVRSLNPAVQS